MFGVEQAGGWFEASGALEVDQDRVLELRELPYGGRWQLRGFGSPAALSTLARACAPLAVGLVEPDPTTYADRSVVLELAGRPTVVQELVGHLDAAGLDGHVRVLRVHEAVDA